MKYLNPEIYYDTSEENIEWERRCSLYQVEFEKIRERLPKRFLKEYDNTGMHDNIISSFKVYLDNTKKSIRYNVIMDLIDYRNKNLMHRLTFMNVKNVKSNIKFEDPCGFFDWLYAEILPVNKKMISLEVLLFVDNSLYIEFEKMAYKKIDNSNRISSH